MLAGGSDRAEQASAQAPDPIPRVFLEQDLGEPLRIDDLDEAAQAYVDLRWPEASAILADTSGASPAKGAEFLATLMIEFRKNATSVETADTATAALRMMIRVAPPTALRFSTSGSHREASEIVRRTLFPAVAILGDKRITVKVALHVASYASTHFLLDELEAIRSDLEGMSLGEPGPMVDAARLVGAMRAYRVGDAQESIRLATAASESSDEMIRRAAAALGSSARALQGTDDLPDEGPDQAHDSPLHLWDSARVAGKTDVLAALLPILLEWCDGAPSPDRAIGYSQGALGLMEYNIQEASRYMLLAAEALDEAILPLGPRERLSLLGVLRGTIHGILTVAMRVSKCGVDSLDRAVFEWMQRLYAYPSIPCPNSTRTLAQLVELHGGLGEQPAPAPWVPDTELYVFYMASLELSFPLAWRFMFSSDGSVVMENFLLGERAARRYVACRDSDATEAIPADGADELLADLIGPWRSLRDSVGLEQEDLCFVDEPVLRRALPQLGDSALMHFDGYSVRWAAADGARL